MRRLVLLVVALLCPVASLADGFVFLGSFGNGATYPHPLVNPYGLTIAPDGTIWVAVAGRMSAMHFTATGTYLSETTSPISNPTGVAVLTSGEIVLASSAGAARYNADGSGKTALGTGSCYAVVADPVGGFWMSQQPTQRILTWPQMGILFRIFGTPMGFAVTPDGTFYIANSMRNCIEVMGGLGPSFEWGSTGSEPGQFSLPSDVEIADGLVYVADSNNNRVQIFRLDGSFVTQFGTAGTGPGNLLRPSGIAVAPDGTIYVSEVSNNRVSRFAWAPVAAQPVSWGRLKSLFR